MTPFLASELGLFKKSVVCAIDYVKIPYYGSFNSYVVRGRHERGTNQFYEYATISIVQDGLRFCVYSRLVTILDSKRDIVRELVEEARRRGIKIAYLLLDRAFFTVECINLLKELNISFIMPAIKNERVKEAIESSREGSFHFSIRDCYGGEASFTLLLHKREDGEIIAFATNISDILEKIPKEYKRRWRIETSFRKKCMA